MIVTPSPGCTVSRRPPSDSITTPEISTSRLPSSGTKRGSSLSSRCRSVRTTSSGAPSACTLPCSSITASSQTSRTMSSACVTSTIVRPSDWNRRDAIEAAALERLVADREHLVDQEDLGVHVDGDGEAEPDQHPRGVELHLVVHELLELGERDDVVVDPIGVPPRQAEERGVEVDVLAAGEIGVEAGAELEERREPPSITDGAGGGSQDPRDALQQRGLPGAVVADQAQRGPLRDVERDIAKRPELLGAGA